MHTTGLQKAGSRHNHARTQIKDLAQLGNRRSGNLQ